MPLQRVWPLPPTRKVNFQTPEATDATPNIVTVKCCFLSSQLKKSEAEHSLKDFHLASIYCPLCILKLFNFNLKLCNDFFLPNKLYI